MRYITRSIARFPCGSATFLLIYRVTSFFILSAADCGRCVLCEIRYCLKDRLYLEVEPFSHCLSNLPDAFTRLFVFTSIGIIQLAYSSFYDFFIDSFEIYKTVKELFYFSSAFSSSDHYCLVVLNFFKPAWLSDICSLSCAFSSPLQQYKTALLAH